LDSVETKSEKKERDVKPHRKTTDQSGTSDQHSALFYVGDVFGEQSLIVEDFNENRTGTPGSDPKIEEKNRIVQHTFIAHSDLYTVDFERGPLLEWLRSTELGRITLSQINMIAMSRIKESWYTLRLNSMFNKIMNRIQLQEFQRLLSAPRRFARYEEVFSRGQVQDGIFLIGSGNMNLFYRPPATPGNDSQIVDETENVDLRPGAVVCDTNAITANVPAHFSLTAMTDCTVYTVPRTDWVAFLDQYPGVKLHCIDRRCWS